jgi:hypothetical protein
VSSVRALAERVRRLEAARTAAKSPVELVFGSFEAFAEKTRADVAAELLDRDDMLGPDGNGGVLRAIQAWHDQKVWGGWRRNQSWQYSG